MVVTQHKVQTLELKRLLYSINDSKLDIGIRLRFIGRMWLEDFVRIIELSEGSARLFDDRHNNIIMISDLSNVIQFELDSPFQHYEPHFHYSVEPGLEE
jgi:hypothetical protein